VGGAHHPSLSSGCIPELSPSLESLPPKRKPCAPVLDPAAGVACERIVNLRKSNGENCGCRRRSDRFGVDARAWLLRVEDVHGDMQPGSLVIANPTFLRCFTAHIGFDPCWTLIAQATRESSLPRRPVGTKGRRGKNEWDTPADSSDRKVGAARP
jgi:hypothetical protein